MTGFRTSTHDMEAAALILPAVLLTHPSCYMHSSKRCSGIDSSKKRLRPFDLAGSCICQEHILQGRDQILLAPGSRKVVGNRSRSHRVLCTVALPHLSARQKQQTCPAESESRHGRFSQTATRNLHRNVAALSRSSESSPPPS